MLGIQTTGTQTQTNPQPQRNMATFPETHIFLYLFFWVTVYFLNMVAITIFQPAFGIICFVHEFSIRIGSANKQIQVL